uniref:F-box domain-containing protein n=1 Tax=Strongyloides papillosus TaxID=174720 RepID=A0A0N5BMV5_STREA
MDRDYHCEVQPIKKANILSLPNELLTELFSWTKLNDVNNLKLACKRFYYAITDNYHKMNIKKAIKISIKGNRYSAYRYHNNIAINLEVVYLRYDNNNNLSEKYFKLSLNTRNNELIKEAAVDFIYRHEKIGNRTCNHQDVELSLIIQRDLEGVWDFLKGKFENDSSLNIEIEVNKFLFIEYVTMLRGLFKITKSCGSCLKKEAKMMNIVSEDSSKKLNIWSYLPNEVYAKIFSYIPLIYLCNVKMVCKKFNLIIENNNNQMLKMVANEVQVFNSKKKKHLLKLHVKFIKSLNECNTPIYKKFKCNIRSRKEFIGRMRMFNLANIHYLNITKCDKVEIFGLLNECMKVNSDIYQMSIERLDDKNILYFKNFIKKFKSIKFLQIPHICTNIQAYENYSYLQLLNIHDFENICLWECQNTRFLNSKFILDLYKNNPNLNYVRIHSNNKNLIREIGVNFFSRQELNNDVVCNHTKMELVLDIRYDITELLNTIKNAYRNGSNGNIRERQTIICYGNVFIKVEKLCQICLNHWMTMKLIITNTNFTFHG